MSYTWVDAGGDQADNGNSVALDAAGHAYCWGDNEEGQCGSSGPNLTEPALVRGLPVIKDARAGAEYSLFLGQNGSVWLAGAFRPDPVEALAAGSATQISAGAGVAAAAGGSAPSPEAQAVGWTVINVGAAALGPAGGSFRGTHPRIIYSDLL